MLCDNQLEQTFRQLFFYVFIYIFDLLSLAPVGLTEDLDAWPPPVSSADQIFCQDSMKIIIFSFLQVTGQVQERVSFLSAMYYIQMTVNAEKYDFTQTYEFAYVSFAMAKPSQEPQWQSLYYPLAYPVWLAIMGSVLLVPLTYIAVNYFIVIRETHLVKHNFHYYI